MCVCIYIYIYIYLYREREREMYTYIHIVCCNTCNDNAHFAGPGHRVQDPERRHRQQGRDYVLFLIIISIMIIVVIISISIISNIIVKLYY